MSTKSHKGKKTKNPTSSIAKLLKKIGKEESIDVHIETCWGHVGRIICQNGNKTYFRGANFDLNGMGSMEIAKDKGYATYFLKQAGYNTIIGKTFYSPKFAKTLRSKDNPKSAYLYAKNTIGFPVIVKPNSSTQGKLVCATHNKKTFMQAVEKICKIDRVFLVQKLLKGHDYRIVVLDGEVISAYERTPFSIVGDGISTINKLINKKFKKYELSGRIINIKKDDFRINNRLKRYNINRSTILPNDKYFALLDNCNLSSGGDSCDVLNDMDASYKKLACDIARDMGLRYSGIDLLIEDDIKKPIDTKNNNYRVIEINAAPGVDHYAKSGKIQEKIVSEIYRKILRAIARSENYK